MSLNDDDFLIYLADTMAEAEDMVPVWIREQMCPGILGWLEDPDGRVRGLVSTWQYAVAHGLGGIHARVHVWAKGERTPERENLVANVTSGYLSPAEWVN